ncbi:hypothetical protein GCM10009868_14170 [Terrabacter aerolatus]|uniref:Glycosyl transferase n=1 Tax=Terrabacter aerolatus TaxID=422442 RepID=A0A512D3H6_9MICO|nr:hypothetical protein [Terrabacter aerolatus]GEO31016.1 hypothetical protein TAE01_28260 [Terrabacter aerolatus]
MSDAADTSDLVLTGVRSRSHLVYASSYLRHVLETRTGPVRLTVLPTGDAFGDGPAAEAAVRDLLVEDPRLLVRFADSAEVVAGLPPSARLLCVGAPSVRVWTTFVRTHRGRPPRVTVIDEGLGSFGTWATRRRAYRREGGGEPRSTVRAVAVASGARWLTDERWSLYARDGRGWRVDERVAREFRHRLEGAPPPPGTAVYLTQPWAALGLLSQTAYAAHLAAVREAVASVGLSLVLRPHPWEQPESYAGFDLVHGRTPAELDRHVVAAGLVLGGNSTALLNLAAVHHTPAARVMVPELASLDAALGSGQRTLLDSFLPPAVPVEELARTLRVGGRGTAPL